MKSKFEDLPPDCHPDWLYILAMGGPTAVGRICEITSQGVSQWRKGGIPKAQRKFLQLLRPDIFVCADAPTAQDPTTQPDGLDAPISQAGELNAV